MKKRWIAIALLTVLLMGIGGAIGKVGVRQESGGSAYALYFVERDLRSADGGDALRSEERTLEDGGLSTEELAAALVAELLKGPADPTLKSPFPKGTALLSAEQKGTELRVDLSAAYSTLSGVGLSLADYAITLTLTQLPDVARVRITVAGRELDYRSRQVFLARDILTVPKEDVVGTVDTSLYFVNGDGALTAEESLRGRYAGVRRGAGTGKRSGDQGPFRRAARGVQGPEGVAGRGNLLCEPVLGVAGGPAGAGDPVSGGSGAGAVPAVAGERGGSAVSGGRRTGRHLRPHRPAVKWKNEQNKGRPVHRRTAFFSDQICRW